MKIVVAMDSLKGCLTSREACLAAAQGVRRHHTGATVVTLPVSDGGDGFLEAVATSTTTTMVAVTVHDPLMRPVTAHFGILPDGTAVIESAQASGLTLLAPHERNPLEATSYGTGELIAAALKHGCRRLVVGLGGSGTSDAGEGMLRALGLVVNGDAIDDRDFVLRRYPEATITIASDVDNPLCGPHGAASVYAPQKGATPAMVAMLEERAATLARTVARFTARDMAAVPGAGAAGGMGFALMALCGATMKSGIEMMLGLVDFDRVVRDASLVVTGEGAADAQTLMGKAPTGVMHRAAACGVPTALLAGRVSDRQRLLNAGFAAVECIHPAATPQAERLQPAVTIAHLSRAAEQMVSRLCK